MKARKKQALAFDLFCSFDHFLLLFQMAQRVWEKQPFGRLWLILMDQNKVIKS